MELHTNGHSKRTTGRKVAKKASSVVKKAEGAATKLAHKGEVALDKTQAAGFLRRNPKKAVGMALGAGLIVGALANRKYLRAFGLGLAGYIGQRFY